jgi:MFS family permease
MAARQFLIPLRVRRFRRIWAGQLVNIVGDAVFGITVPLFLLHRDDAPATIGAVLAAGALGAVVSLFFAGALADRHRRSRLIVVADLVRAAGLVAMLVIGADANRYALVGCTAIVGIGAGLYRPAYMVLLPTLVDGDEVLAAVNGLRVLTGRFSIIAGGILTGGLVTWFAPRTVLLFDLLSFVVSVLSLLGLGETMPTAKQRPTLLMDVRAGFTYVAQRRWMLAVMVQGAVQVAVVASVVSVCLPLLLGRDGIWYGTAIAVEAIGAVVGVSLATSWDPARRGLVAMLALLCQMPQLVAIALDIHPIVVVVLSGGAGFGLSLFAVLWTTALQHQVAPDQLGRVFAVDQLTATIFGPVGLSIAGWAVAIQGVSPTAWAAAGVLVSSVAAALPVAGVAAFAAPTSVSTRAFATRFSSAAVPRRGCS